MKKVAVVILGWNGKAFLEKFLPSVVAHTPGDWCEVVVADNCSTDGSVEYVKANYPSVTVIQNSHNGGYAGGYNEALSRVKAEYYVLLNQDIEVTAGWIEKIVNVMDADKQIAAAQPKLRAYNEREYFEYAGAAGGYLDSLSYAFCRGRIFHTIEKDEGQYDSVADIFWATGACLFVRADAFWEAGALDQDFFAHQEEIDLCWRLKNLGYRVVAVPHSVVYHVGGGSLEYGNPRKTYLNFRNNLFMMFKNLPFTSLWKIPFRFLLDDLAAFHFVWKEKRFQNFVSVYKARWHFITALPALFKKRKQVKRVAAATLYPGSIVWQYYITGKKKFSSL